jgi:acetyltransferase-like isoleucine patch superfamily enzyme
MNRGLVLCALALGLVLPASAPAAATDAASTTTTSSGPEAVLVTATVDAALLPADPDVVTDAELAGVGASPAVQQLNNDPNQLVVDDDLAQCPNADFTTPAGIQAAIAAAAPGARIRVCPGSYSPINVNKAELWLQAPRTQGNANGCREGNPAQDAMITGTNTAGLVQIVAAGVRFEGFIVHGNTTGPGIRTDASGSGYELVFNEVRANQYGIDLNTNGTVETLIEHNCIRDNAGFENGILSSAGFSNVAIENNFFTGHNCAAIWNSSPATAAGCFLGPFVPVADVSFSHNSLVDDTTATFDGATNILIEGNEWVRPFGASIVVDDFLGLDIRFNHIDGENKPISQGIFIGAASGVAQNALVKSNKIENLVGGSADGFQFFGAGLVINAAGVTARENRIEFNRGTGIHLRPQSDGNVIHGNLLVGNGVPGTDLLPVVSGPDGIRVRPGAVGNVIENNRLGEPLGGADPEERANRDHDCHDDNPSGANAWRHNVGYTENQPGLCVRPA